MTDPATDRMGAHSGANPLATSADPHLDTRSEVRSAARRGLTAAVGAVSAAFLASLCCVGPLVFVAFGVGAGLASTFEPLRPMFTLLTVALLAVGFYVVYGKRRAAAECVDVPHGTCTGPRNRTRDNVFLWIATVVSLAFLTFPRWSLLLL